ncbi:MAG: geranylgeranylglyceryl/heptaprenylglyceryl phosphate synthase [Saprospiraceae bacterium]
MSRRILEDLREARRMQRKRLGLLLDPDKFNPAKAAEHLAIAEQAGVHYILVGGSLLLAPSLAPLLDAVRAHTQLPTLLFPGNAIQLSDRADGILLLSLISGRNPELLIGQHVVAAPYLRRTQLEIIPTGYILVDGGSPTAVQYMSNTQPIPADKPEIAACTAMAGEMLGLQALYVEAGSGAPTAISAAAIRAVREAVSVPLIVGGGIRDADAARKAWDAGADMVVVGTAFEQRPESILKIGAALP